PSSPTRIYRSASPSALPSRRRTAPRSTAVGNTGTSTTPGGIRWRRCRRHDRGTAQFLNCVANRELRITGGEQPASRGCSLHFGGDPPGGAAGILDTAASVLVVLLDRLLDRLGAGGERPPVGLVHVRNVDVHVRSDRRPPLDAVRDHDH